MIPMNSVLAALLLPAGVGIACITGIAARWMKLRHHDSPTPV
jgi:hypothetical protein